MRRTDFLKGNIDARDKRKQHFVELDYVKSRQGRAEQANLLDMLNQFENWNEDQRIRHDQEIEEQIEEILAELEDA